MGSVTDQATALVLQIDQVVRVATAIVKQTDFGEAAGRTTDVVRHYLIVRDAAEQVVRGRHAVARAIGRIATEVASLALAHGAELTVAGRTEGQQVRIDRRSHDRDRALGLR